jgi:hypothetical protein
MVDYPLAQDLLVNEQRTFINALAGLPGDQLSVVIHKTGGTPNLASLASFFQTDTNGANTHLGVDLDGTVGQFVWLKDGAGGNCCLEVGHDTYWDSFLAKYGNLNLCTFSIEHIDPTQDNSTTPPQAQLDASFALVKWLVDTYHIPLDHIKTHASLDPVSRARCPGNYPMAELLTFLQNGGIMIPTGWKDDGTTLTAPNGVAVRLGFRDFVLANNWHPGNYPLAPEQGVTLLEASNPGLGGGDQQVFRWSMLGYTAARGVFMEWTGQELAYCRQQLTTYYQLSKKLQAELDSLNQQPAGPDPKTVADRLTAIGLAANNGNAAIQQLITQPL